MAFVDGERVKKELGITGATKTGKTRNTTTYMAYEIVDAIDDNKIGRCKDCIYNTHNTDGVAENYCYKWGEDIEPEDFCSRYEEVN